MRVAFGVVLFAVTVASQALAQPRVWCERNCVSLCAAVASATGVTADACIASRRCSQYAGKPCAAPAAVNARVRGIRAARAGGSTSAFDACRRRWSQMGWSTVEVAGYCSVRRR